MSPPSVLRPRDEVFAARTLTALFLAAGGLLIAYVVVEPAPLPPGGLRVAVALLVGLLAVAAGLCVAPRPLLTRCAAWLALPLIGELAIGAIAVALPERLDLVHPLLGLTVLYAASQLRAPGAAVVTGQAVAIDATLIAALEPPAEAVVDALFVAAVLIATAVLLVLVMNQVDRLLASLQRQAAVDPLTGLVTRRVLDDALASALSASTTRQGTALILVDVDGFKSVNDAHGHPVGDDALVHLAGVLRSHVRAGDAVLGRLGGDELAVLLPGCSAATAAQRAEELVAAVRAAPLRLFDGTLLALSVSIGVAHSPEHATELRGLYAAADTALYAAKRGGRGRAVTAIG